ncbi:MAG: hypothetical protein WAP51_04935, partial [Candidatus Sungiibacteriota bacterium]
MQNFSDELKKEAFDFAFAVHRVTELFPKEEALKKELREYSAGLLAKVSGLEFAENSDRLTLTRNTLGALEALKNLIFLSQKTGLMKAINAEVLERERTTLEIYFQHECDVLARGQGKEQKRDEIRPKAKVQSDTEGINPALKNGVAFLRRAEDANNSQILATISDKKPKKTEMRHGVTPFSSDGVNDTKISVSDILKAQKQVIKTPLVAPGASTTSSISDADGSPDNGINERQGAIIGYLKANKEA